MLARLKSLELHGYKTFASRTVFEFAPNVTAIVGPNGSGKSNIADSMRWVLGEQSYALLRGKKTEDMIFIGSESRPRAGMAAATITFDNTDGWLPIDFSEVAITRRAYRDGQNEYLLNGQRVRLKDVTELLAQSGLAERTYTIIGQGLVDAALALKAEERRRLFEEAAGIGLYRTRREDATRRLETTLRNLDRVHDILSELEPRLHSLEKQARRSLEYEQIKADLRLALREWYGYHWHHELEALSQAKETSHIQEDALHSAKEAQDSLASKITGLRSKIQEVRTYLNENHRRASDLHSRLDVSRRDLAISEERIRSIGEQESAAAQEKTRLEEEVILLQDRLSGIVQEIDGLVNQLDGTRSKAQEVRSRLDEKRNQRQRVERDIQSLRQDLSKSSARIGTLGATVSEKKSRLDQNRVQSGKLQQSVTETESRLDAVRKHLIGMERRYQDSQAAVSEYEGIASALRKKIDELDRVHQKYLAEKAKISESLARLKAQRDVIDQAENSLSGYAEGTRMLIQAFRENKVERIRGILSQFMDIPADLITPLSAVLYEYLDAAVIDGETEDTTAQATSKALDFLLKNSTRGVLLPVSRMRVKAKPGRFTPSDEGIIGLASELVQFPGEIKPLVEALLGGTLIVRDRSVATRVLAGTDVLDCAVTMAGEIFLSKGPVLVSGEGKKSAAAVILSRKSQIKELTLSIEEMEQMLTELTRKLSDNERELNTCRLEEQDGKKELANAARASAENRTGRDQAQLAVEKTSWQLKQEKQRHLQLQEEAAGSTSEIARLESDLQKAETLRAESRAKLQQAERELAQFNVQDLQTELGRITTGIAVAEQSLADKRERKQEFQTNLDKASRAIATLEYRAVELKQNKAQLESKMDDLKSLGREISGEIDRLLEIIQPSEAELRTYESQLDELLIEENTARGVVSYAEQRFSQARIAQARKQESIDALRRRIEDDVSSFSGLVSFDYSEDVSGPTPLPLAGLVEQLPRIVQLNPEVEENIKRQRALLRRMGPINPEALTEYKEVKQRFEFLNEQVMDLEKAEKDVRQVIHELDDLMKREFRKTYDAVAAEFKVIFSRLFAGGTARLVLTDPDDLTNSGIDIEARLPGRRTQGLSLLSGGERSLTASALVFSLLKISPTPFCVLDEVDAMLDEANVGRFREQLRELSQNTQFIIVTHNRNTVQVADVIYGITMGRDSASQVVSLKLDEIDFDQQ
jgi:chromosome segregation protein